MNTLFNNFCYVLAVGCLLCSCKYGGRLNGKDETQVADTVCASSDKAVQARLAAEIVHSGRMLYDYRSDTLSAWAEDMNLCLVVVRGNQRKDYLLTKEEIKDILDPVSEYDYYYSTFVNAEPDTVINNSAFFSIETCIPDTDLNYCFTLIVNPDDSIDMIGWDYYDCEDGMGNYVRPDFSRTRSELSPSVSINIPENQLITSNMHSGGGSLLKMDGNADAVFPDFVPKTIDKPDLSNLYSHDNTVNYQFEDPVFQDGAPGAFSRWVESELEYPDPAREHGMEGRVIVGFTICSDGYVRDVRVLHGVDEILDSAAVRVVSRSPEWIPGKNSGKPVNVKYTIPVIFSLSSDE